MKDVIEIFFGTEGVWPTIGFIFFALLGMMFIKLLSYNRKKKEYNSINYPDRLVFNKAEWLDDNIIDFVLAFVAAFGMFRFFPDAMNFLSTQFNIPQLGDKMAYGVLLGLFFQYILHKLMNNVTVQKTGIKINNTFEKKPDTE